MNGQYSIVNYQIGTDTLTLGTPDNGFWFETGDPVSRGRAPGQDQDRRLLLRSVQSGRDDALLDGGQSGGQSGRGIQCSTPNANFDGMTRRRRR